MELIVLVCLPYKIFFIIEINDLSLKIHREGVYRQRQLWLAFVNSGKVYLIYDNKSLQLYVAKKISLEGLKFLEIDRTMREIEIHKDLNHPNIIAFK